MTNSIVINKTANPHWGKKTNMDAIQRLIAKNTRSLTNEEIDIMLGKKVLEQNTDTTNDGKNTKQKNSD